MDTTSRPQHYPTSVTEILERAERLSAGEIRALASAYRGESLAGQQDPNQRERGHKRARAVSIAISRSGRGAEAQALQEAVSAAVRASAARERMRSGARTLGIVGDAELAVGDAALAALLADHLSKEVSLLLREPFDALEPAAPVPAAGDGR